MKYTTNRLAAVFALLAGTALVRLSAATITLDADNLLGTIDPGGPASETNATAQVKFLVDAYNLGTANGTNLGDNPLDGGAPEAYTLYRPASAPGTLAAPVSFGKIDTSDPVVDLNGFTYQYILYFQASNAWVYYIGNISGANDINWGGNPLTNPDLPNQDGSEIGHYVLFNQSMPTPGPQNSIPDGGTTVFLVGLGLLVTAFSARRRMAA